MPDEVGADRHGFVMLGRPIGGGKDDVEAVFRREMHIGPAERGIEAWIDGGFEPALIPTGQRSDVCKQKARVEEIGRIADHLRERELIWGLPSNSCVHCRHAFQRRANTVLATSPTSPSPTSMQ